MAGTIAEEIAEEAYRRRGYRPLTLSERQRRFLEWKKRGRGELTVQPRPEGVAVISQVKTIEGIPHDVLVTLEALRQQAEAGNRFAKFLYETERESLGIDRPRIVVPAR